MSVVELEEKAFANDVVVNDSSDFHCSAETKILIELPQTEEEMRHCNLCNYQAEDWPKFAKHVFKPYHVRKIADSYNIRLSTEPVSNTFSCDICSFECQGHPSWVSHLMGKTHIQAIDVLCSKKTQDKSGGPIKNNQSDNRQNKKPYQKNTVSKATTTTPALAANDFANYPEPLIGLEYVTEIQGTGDLPCYRCSICEMKFDSNFKFPHLVGQKHRINVLKIKRPESLKGVNSTVKKRSEITAILVQEATRLEQDEGRQQVKTKVFTNSSSSFNANNSLQSGTGRGASRGGRGATRGTTGSSRGGKAQRGVRGVGRGNPGPSRGASRGNSGYSNGAGVGDFGYAKRGAYNSRGNAQSRGGFNMGQASYHPASAGPSGSYRNDSFYDSYGKESFDVRNNESFDSPDYGGGSFQSQSSGPVEAYSGYGQTYSGPSQAYSGPSQAYSGPSQAYSGPGQTYYGSTQAYSSQTYTGNGSKLSDSGRGYSAPPLQSPQEHYPPKPPKEPDTPKTKEEISSGLASALGDLTKLVQNEDDASVALHVSNALTQALLQYRMQESGTEGEK